jgi:hypothetical protein
MRTLLCLALFAASAVAATALADPGVIARGDERARLQNTPIEQRPYRPLHFYGNTVRRRHYRSVSRPTRSSSKTVRSASQSGSTRATRATRAKP